VAARVWFHSLEVAQRVARRAGLLIDVLAVEPLSRQLAVGVVLLARVLPAHHGHLAPRVAREGHSVLVEITIRVTIKRHVPLPDRVARVHSVVKCHLSAGRV